MNKYFKTLVSAAVLILSAAGCREQKNGRDDIVAVEGYEEAGADCPEYGADCRIVRLEESENTMLFNIKQVEVADSSYVVFDNGRQALYRFSLDGKFLNGIGRIGRAGNEYLRLDTFVITPEGRVLLFDGASDKILVYGLDGKYHATMTFPKRSLGFVNEGVCIGKDSLLVNNGLFNNENGIYRIIHLSDCRVETMERIPMKSEGIAEYVGMHPVSRGDDITLLRPFDDAVYALDGSGKLQPLFKVHQSKPLVEESYYETNPVFSTGKTYMELTNKGYFPGFTSLFESNRHYLLGYFNTDYFLVDKQAKRGIRMTLSRKAQGTFPVINIVGSADDTFIGVWEPSGFTCRQILSQFEEASGENVPGIVKELGDIPENANPCLLLYRFN